MLAREVAATAVAQRVSTMMVAFLAAAMCVTTLLTVGRAAAAEQQVAARLDAAGSRTLTVTDVNEAGFLDGDVVAAVAAVGVVDRAVGTALPVDVTSASVGAGGSRVPAWQVIGDIRDVAEVTWGRWPRPGEALVSATAMEVLALDAPVGAVRTRAGVTVPVVGAFTARDPFDDVAAGVLIAAPAGVVALVLHVVATDAATVPSTQGAVLAILARPPTDLQVVSPVALAELQGEVMGDLARYGRGLLLAVLAAGALLTAVVVLADVLVHRADLGRRRALGAPRWVIVALVTGRVTLAATVGVVVGSVVTAVLLARTGQAPVPAFALGTAILAVLAAAVAALPPALAASHRDPVHVLRTP